MNCWRCGYEDREILRCQNCGTYLVARPQTNKQDTDKKDTDKKEG